MKVLPKAAQNSFDLDVQILATDMCRQEANPLYLAKSLDTASTLKRLGDLVYTAKFLSRETQEAAYRISREFSASNVFAFCRLMFAGRNVRKLVYLSPAMVDELEAFYFEGTASNMI